jgi:hypothetical protein
LLDGHFDPSGERLAVTDTEGKLNLIVSSDATRQLANAPSEQVFFFSFFFLLHTCSPKA